MSRSKPDPVLEGVELLFHQMGGSVCFGAKMACDVFEWSGSGLHELNYCRAMCSNVLHDITN
jgi:hypothetical protein